MLSLETLANPMTYDWLGKKLSLNKLGEMGCPDECAATNCIDKVDPSAYDQAPQPSAEQCESRLGDSNVLGSKIALKSTRNSSNKALTHVFCPTSNSEVGLGLPKKGHGARYEIAVPEKQCSTSCNVTQGTRAP